MNVKEKLNDDSFALYKGLEKQRIQPPDTILMKQNKQIKLILLLTQFTQMRPFSQKSNRSNHPKYRFQTKLKSRINGQPYSDHHFAIDDTCTPSKSFNHQNSRHVHTQCQIHDDQFNQSAQKLERTNFSHHNPTLCLCNDCQCGRHLCKMHVIKPDLSKATVYQKSFQQQKAKPVLITFARQYDRLKGPNLDMNTTYTQGFNRPIGDNLQRPHPQDLLHSQGPAQNLTSYSTQFPGFRGENQYVKPTDRHFRGYFPLRSKSTYSNAFSKKQYKKQDYKYIKDQLKTGSCWLGETTYGGFYSNPNPEYFAKPVKIIEKKEDNPDYSLQYQTTYKNNYISKGNKQCPAKVYLETRAKGSFSESKVNFSQNCDYKALSPNFQAISTSKQYYV